jgi:cobalt/nickel transport system permease protein
MFLSPNPLHIPDGFLNLPLALLLWLPSLVLISIALKKVRLQMGERQAPLLGVLAAAIFAGQLFNFSVTGGTSGHLLGAALATILAGPWAAVLIMTSVVSVQALIFQDGGLIALGANLFNMAGVGVFVSHAVFILIQKLARNERRGIFIGASVAAWVSIMITALACALQLSISGIFSANLAIPMMAGVHTLIGLGEAAITLGAVRFLYAARKDLFSHKDLTATQSTGTIIVGSILVLLLTILAPLASTHPDGLAWVVNQQGFLASSIGTFYELIPDYVFPGLANPKVATIAAGVIGSILVLTVVLLLTRSRKPFPRE